MKQLIFILSTLHMLHSSFTLAFAATTIGLKLPATGQTTSYATGDDGDLQAGIPWPEPRFTDNANGTVTDNLTGLIWLQDANCAATFGGVTKTTTLTWADALTWSNSLKGDATGTLCGLKDGSTAGQWRLPNIIELESLVNGQAFPVATWLNSQGFSGVRDSDGGAYWSSSTYAYDTGSAGGVGMISGRVGHDPKNFTYYVWPVRGGQ